jgi:hypothetical protein
MIKELIQRCRQFAMPIEQEQKEQKEIPNVLGVAVAVWEIKQMIVCPYCDFKFDVIASNLRRKVNQGTRIVKGIEVVKLGDGRSQCETMDTISEIPTPPFFGAMMQDTENLDEHIPCDKCKKDINVKETHWQYGI